jgi:hypothetical protein
MPVTAALFLDWDDVLILPHLHGKKRRWRVSGGRKVCYLFAPDALAALRAVLDACPAAALVLSSTWRGEGRAMVETVLRMNGAAELAGRFHPDWITPDGANRAAEIDGWLAVHPDITAAAALDDDPAIAGRPWAVLIDPGTGLTNADAARAVALLSAQQLATDSGL